MIDTISKQRISKLHPSVREEVTKIMEEIDKALSGRAKIRIVQGLRTFAEQDALYAQGRTKPGKIVTNAKGGQSNHCYGTAIDFCLIIDGKEVSWDTEKDYDNDHISDWKECVAIFKKYKWKWGGDFSSIRDYPHFEKEGLNDWKILQKLPRDKEGYVILKL